LRSPDFLIWILKILLKKKSWHGDTGGNRIKIRMTWHDIHTKCSPYRPESFCSKRKWIFQFGGVHSKFQKWAFWSVGRISFLPLNINILELFKKHFIQQDSIYLSVPRSPGLVASVALEAVPNFDKKSKITTFHSHKK
jgi:hypothetical protein